MTKKSKNRINGVLLLDKPEGLSSNQAIRKLAWLLNAEKVGHTGTLDPMATGLLPVCLGEATKFAAFLLDGDKEYIATAQLGIITDSGDREGNLVESRPVNTSLPAIEAALNSFTGQIRQIPPMYSALKHNGRPLYEYARAGIHVDRPERNVFIYELELINYDCQLEQITFRALVSKGTYIRTLAEDIGNTLGCGASLISLRRTRSNQFSLTNSISLDDLVHSPEEVAQRALLASDCLVQDLPKYELKPEQFAVIKYGNLLPLEINPFPENEIFRLYAASIFIGVAGYYYKNEQRFIKPGRLLSGLADLVPWP